MGPALFDVGRRLRYPETERSVRADLEQTCRQLAWLRESMSEPGPEAPRLLILSLTDSVYQLKLEGMLGAGLKLQGWRPIVLTDSPASTRAQRYFAAFGLRDFVYLDDWRPSPRDREDCALAAGKLLGGEMTFQSVKGWAYDGSWIGPQVLSTVSRHQHEGAPDPSDPETRTAIEALLPQVLLRVATASRVVRHLRADLGLVIEANYTTYGPFVDQLIASGTNVVQVTQPWRDDALILRRLTPDTRRMHPSSVAGETLTALGARPWTREMDAALDRMFEDRYSGKWFLQARNQPGTARAEDETIARRLELDPDKRTAVVFSHILWDANLFYGDDLFQDYGEWFVETVKAAAANANLNWVIKLHPANLWKRARDGVDGEYSELRLIREQVGDLPGHVKLLPPDADIDTLSLFRFADYGVTVRGTSGMELPCFGKPTLTAGTGRYSDLGFTVDSSSREAYLGRLAALHELEPMSEAQRRLARLHAYAAFVLRPWRMRSFRTAFDHRERGHHALDQNLACTVESAVEASNNGDLARWAAWAADGAVDYLEDLDALDG
jgi:hypothetical protein